jgi:ParB family chromosome partitioning protein
LDPNTEAVQDALATHLGTPVRVVPSGKGGKIEITYYSDEDLERIVDTLGVVL